MGGWSLFPELNVRTYVVRDGKPGVYFFSLDAASLLAVRMARALFHLPYFHANMKAEDQGDRLFLSAEGWIGGVSRTLRPPFGGGSAQTREPGALALRTILSLHGAPVNGVPR
jgi:uncharacterized protein YqjF (DUF2071 family)